MDWLKNIFNSDFSMVQYNKLPHNCEAISGFVLVRRNTLFDICFIYKRGRMDLLSNC